MATARAIVLTGDEVAIDPSDVTDLPLWSAVEISSTPSSNPLQAFSYKKGDPVPGSLTPTGQQRAAKLSDTNLLDAGRMNDAEGMRVTALTIQYFSVGGWSNHDGVGNDQGYAVDRPFISMLDLARLHCDTIGRLVILKAAVASYRLGDYPTGPDIVVTTSGGRRREGIAGQQNVDGFAIGVNGVPTMMGMKVFGIIHKLNPTTEFTFDFFFPDNGVDSLSRRIFARVFLHGPRRREATPARVVVASAA